MHCNALKRHLNEIILNSFLQKKDSEKFDGCGKHVPEKTVPHMVAEKQREIEEVVQVPNIPSRPYP
jgi:hypothetical protein